ncbi:MAG: class I SAM-dependent methyltransferase [Nanoarchaeota archaeon]|nr:class I SAM-dependent methyltransferase [Nanoarchaeota archaeon]
MNNQQVVWDKIAPYWVKVKQRKYRSIEQMYQEVLKDWKKGMLLDVGCGGGRDAVVFARDGFEVTAVDFSSGMLAEAEKRIKRENIKVKLVQADAIHLPFADASFEYVWCCNVMSTIVGAEHRQQAFNELYRVLKPGSEAVIGVWNKLQKRFVLKPKEINLPWKAGNEIVMRTYAHFFPWELKRCLRKAGFSIVKMTGFFGPGLVVRVKKE